VLALLLEPGGQVHHRELRLGQRHPVTRDEDDGLRVAGRLGDPVQLLLDRQLDRGRRGRGDLGCLGGRRVGPAGGVGDRRDRTARGPGVRGAHEEVQQAAVHRLAHRRGQDEAGRPDGGTTDDQQAAVQRESSERGGKTGRRVQERDHDRHVRAADPDREEVAHHEREQDQDRQHQQRHRPGQAPGDDARDGRRQRRSHQERIDRARLPGVLHAVVQLRRGDEAAGERESAEHDADEAADAVQTDRRLVGEPQLRGRDDQGRQAAHAVLDRDHRRHLGHVDPVRAEEPQREADDQDRHEQDGVAGARSDQDERHGGQDGDQRRVVAEAGAGRVAEPRDPEEQQADDRELDRENHTVGKRYAVKHEHLRTRAVPGQDQDAAFFVLNIFSILWDTR